MMFFSCYGCSHECRGGDYSIKQSGTSTEIEAASILQALSSLRRPAAADARKQSSDLAKSTVCAPRTGKWTREEEDFARAISTYFCLGMLDLPNGTTLRAYLAYKLNCDPMRVTKKFSHGCSGPIGKKAFRREDVAPCDITSAQRELDMLEHIFQISHIDVTTSHIEKLQELQRMQRRQLIQQQQAEQHRVIKYFKETV